MARADLNDLRHLRGHAALNRRTTGPAGDVIVMLYQGIDSLSSLPVVLMVIIRMSVFRF